MKFFWIFWGVCFLWLDLVAANAQVVFNWKILDEKHGSLLAGSDPGYGNAHPNASRKGCDLPL